MCEANLYNEINEFIYESIKLNEATIRVENTHLKDEEVNIYIEEVKFQCGLHIDRQRNVKELIAKREKNPKNDN